MNNFNMKKIAAAIGLASVISLPGLALAREVTLTTQMNSYGGNKAYLAFYLTDANGQYHSTLWVAGKQAKYYKHLRDWTRGRGLSAGAFDGVTGASVGSGNSLIVRVELADALIDAGYQIRIDSAVEGLRDKSADVSAPLTTQGTGAPSSGTVYIDTFTYDL